MGKSKDDPMGMGGVDCLEVAGDSLLLWDVWIGEAWGKPCLLALLQAVEILCFLKFVPEKISELAEVLLEVPDLSRCLLEVT